MTLKEKGRNFYSTKIQVRNDCIQNSFCEANQRKILLEVGLKMHKCVSVSVYMPLDMCIFSGIHVICSLLPMT